MRQIWAAAQNENDFNEKSYIPREAAGSSKPSNEEISA